MRELIWQYPLAFAWIVCIGVSAIGVIGVVACFSIKQKDDSE